MKRLQTKLTKKVSEKVCHIDKLFFVFRIAKKDEENKDKYFKGKKYKGKSLIDDDLAEDEELKILEIYEAGEVDIPVLKMYEEGEDIPVLKPFLGQTTGYGSLQELLTGKTPLEHSSALQELIRSYENNKELISQLFANLLQYINDLFSNVKDEEEMRKSYSITNSLFPYFDETALIDRVSSRKYFAELLTEKYNNYKKNPSQIPDFDTLIFFWLVSPTSDFGHLVATPCLIFMSEILTTCRFQDARSIIRGLYVSTLTLDYTLSLKRYTPAAINFLRGVLFLSIKPTISNPIKPMSPFNLHEDAKILILEDDCSKLDCRMKITLKDFVTDSIDNGLKIRTLFNTVSLLELFLEIYPAAQVKNFEAHGKLLSSLELELYPEKVASTVERVKNHITLETNN